jgi:hypothetical protein
MEYRCMSGVRCFGEPVERTMLHVSPVDITSGDTVSWCIELKRDPFIIVVRCVTSWIKGVTNDE